MYQKQIQALKKQKAEVQGRNMEKMQQYRERLKDTEKTIYTQVESEYSSIIQEKDELLNAQKT